MKHFFSAFFLLMTITSMAQTFPKKYVDSLTSVALSTKSNYPLVLNRDSVLKLMGNAGGEFSKRSHFFGLDELGLGGF